MTWFTFSLFLYACLIINNDVTALSEAPLLLVMSIDGFRWDYLEKVKCAGKRTPNFDKLIDGGIFIQNGVKNSYQTTTLPNHYTMVTGLYEESHGAIANDMFDPQTNRTFHLSTRMQGTTNDSFWYANGDVTYKGFPEPIWLTNNKSRDDVTRRSAVISWPGGQAKGMTPDYYEFDPGMNLTAEIVDKIITWFTQKVDPINLCLFYIYEPDHSGHTYGPNSEYIHDVIVQIDKQLGYLIQRLEESGLYNRLNFIITSDHGMAEVHDVIELDDYVSADLYTSMSSGPVWNILPKQGNEEEVYNSLKSIPKLKVYKKQDIPERYHYKKGRWVTPILIEAPQGTNICHNKSQNCTSKGIHGYDNDYSAMHPIFIAHGPIFKKHHVGSQFNNVDLYPLMCHILEVNPAPNNGSLDNVKDILYFDYHNLNKFTMIGSLVVCVTVAVAFCLASLRLCRKQRHALSSASIPLAAAELQGKASQKSPLLMSSDDEFA